MPIKNNTVNCQLKQFNVSASIFQKLVPKSPFYSETLEEKLHSTISEKLYK